MALSIDTQNMNDFPGNIKRVSIDQKSLVLSGYDGDEQFMNSFSTSAYSDNTNRTNIQDYYVTSFKAGWCKSSGFTGTSFALDATHNSIEVKIDSTTSGISGGYYRVTLDHLDGIPIGEDVIAENIEAKLKEIAYSLGTEDTGYKLAYLNASVEFIGSRFWIVSGSISQYYSGANKSSVSVRPSAINDCSEMLGFDLPITSEIMSRTTTQEALALTSVSGSTGSVTINQSVGAAINDCMAITNNVTTDYFQVTNVVGGTVISFDPTTITNSYVASKSKVQLLRMHDVDSTPGLWFDNIDKLMKHGIKTMINQIDYSV